MVFLGVMQDFVGGEGEERAKEFAVEGRDAGHPFQAGAAGEVQQDGFGVVVGVMGGDDIVEGGGDLVEPFVAQVAGGHFDGFSGIFLH